MTIEICPRCNNRYIVDDNKEDYIHECNSRNATLDNEDVPIVGNWKDYTGTGTEQNVMLKGSENELFGTRAAIEGEDLGPLTTRGKRVSTHRTRQHLQFIKGKGGTNK